MLFQDTLAIFDSSPDEFIFERFQDELIDQMKRPLGLRYDQILLEITNGQQEQRRSTLVDLPTPAGPPEIPPVGQENPAASSTGQAQIQSPATGLQTSRPRAPGYIYPASSAATSPTTATDRQGRAEVLAGHIVSPVSTRIQQTRQRLAGLEENIYLSSVKQPCRQSQCKSAVCTITDLWYIERSIDTPRSCDSTSLTWLKRSLCVGAPGEIVRIQGRCGLHVSRAQ